MCLCNLLARKSKPFVQKMLDLWAILIPFREDFRTLCMQMTRQTHEVESKLIEICRSPVAPDLIGRAAITLLDWLGCIIAARHTPVARSMERVQGVAEGRLLQAALSTHQFPAQTSALSFGTLGNVLEMDDLHRASILHPGDAVCAAALATALHEKSSGAALLMAVVRGYEAAVRIGKAAATGGYTPFYNSGTCGVFGAAVAAADLKQLSAEVMLDAMGQAGMQAAGIWQCRLEPGFSKQLACAHAARAGVFSAELAAAGFAGAKAILTGDLGFFASYYPNADQSALTTPDDWALTQMSFKPFAACRHTHPAISAALDLGWQGAPDEVQRITVKTYGAALDFCDAPEPGTADAARFSLQHAVATALMRGAPSIVDFEGSALADPAIMAVRRLVQLEKDARLDAAFPQAYGAAVCLSLKNGTVYEKDCPAAWGDPENPMSRADLIAKFCGNAAYGGVGTDAADSAVNAVLGLADAPDLSDFHAAFTTALSPQTEFA
jgi:2-methylcitrate dehydratase PrpD